MTDRYHIDTIDTTLIAGMSYKLLLLALKEIYFGHLLLNKNSYDACVAVFLRNPSLFWLGSVPHFTYEFRWIVEYN
jgi:hypothetical protein